MMTGKNYTKEEKGVLNRMNIQSIRQGSSVIHSIPYGKASDTGMTEHQFVKASLGLNDMQARKLIMSYLDDLDAGRIKKVL